MSVYRNVEEAEAEKKFINHMNTIVSADANLANLMQWKSWLEYQKDTQKSIECSRLLREVKMIKEKAENGRRNIETTYPNNVELWTNKKTQ